MTTMRKFMALKGVLDTPTQVALDELYLLWARTDRICELLLFAVDLLEIENRKLQRNE
jgi:hypothetical protein